MTMFFALAGLAEAGEYYSILLWRVLAIASVLIAIWATMRPSQKKIWSAVVLMAVVIVIVQPWTDFSAQPASADPDVGYWQERWRDFSTFLIGAAAVCGALSLYAYRRLRRAIET